MTELKALNRLLRCCRYDKSFGALHSAELADALTALNSLTRWLEPTPMLKECDKCGEVKALVYFARLKKGKHGVRGYCKECENMYRRCGSWDKVIELRRKR